MGFHIKEEYKADGEKFVNKLMEIAGYKKQKDLADEMGVTSSYVSKWKKGSMPSQQILIDFAIKHECSIDDLLGLNDTNETEPKLFEITKDLLLYCVLNEMEKNIAQDKIEIRKKGDSFTITISDECFKKEGMIFDATVSSYNSSRKLLSKLSKAEKIKYIKEVCYQNRIS